MIKIIRSIKKPIFPVKTKPFYIFLYAFNILFLFFNGISIINDVYNANPESVEVALSLLADLDAEGGHKVAVLGDMLELGNKEVSFHKDLKKYIKFNSYYQVITCGVLIKNLHKKCAHINNILYSLIYWLCLNSNITKKIYGFKFK